jgi:hypothetical protein
VRRLLPAVIAIVSVIAFLPAPKDFLVRFRADPSRPPVLR